jgi:hypothetical protein
MIDGKITWHYAHGGIIRRICAIFMSRLFVPGDRLQELALERTFRAVRIQLVALEARHQHVVLGRLLGVSEMHQDMHKIAVVCMHVCADNKQ